jgi:hypothetical protein
MPKTKSKNFPPVRADDLLYEFTEKCAEEADEYLSVYIRKAIKMRNAQFGKEKTDKAISMTKEELETKIKPDSVLSHPDMEVTAKKLVKPVVQELKEKVKQMENKDYFRPCPKGTK